MRPLRDLRILSWDARRLPPSTEGLPDAPSRSITAFIGPTLVLNEGFNRSWLSSVEPSALRESRSAMRSRDSKVDS
jgi:hypothetical protein